MAAPLNQSSWINDVTAGTEHYLDRIAGGNSKTPQKTGDINPSMVKAKNLSGGEVLRGHALQVGNRILDKVNFRRLWLEGKKYDKDKEKRVGIVRRAAKDDQFTWLQMIGVTTALVDVTNVEHTHAEPQDDSLVLKSGDSGFAEFLSDITSTGMQEVEVLIGGGGGGEPASVTTVMIYYTLDAAEYKVPLQGTKELLIKQEYKLPQMVQETDGEDWERNSANWSTYEYKFLTDAFVPDGRARIGYAIGNKIVAVDCTTFVPEDVDDLPDPQEINE